MQNTSVLIKNNSPDLPFYFILLFFLLFQKRKQPAGKMLHSMLFAIPYCMTQSFLVSYVEERGLNVSVSLFFPVYAVILLVLRFSMKSLFDKLPFGVFLFAGSACAAISIL